MDKGDSVIYTGNLLDLTYWGVDPQVANAILANPSGTVQYVLKHGIMVTFENHGMWCINRDYLSLS